MSADTTNFLQIYITITQGDVMLINIKDDNSERVRYDYPDYPVYIRRSLLSIFPNFTADSHWHGDIELIAVQSGEMKYNIDGETVVLRQGEGIVVNSRRLHFGYSDSKSECDFICLLFNPVVLCTSKMFETRFVDPFVNSDIPYVFLSDTVEWQGRILDFVRDIWDNREAWTSPLCSQGLIFSIWNEIAQNVEPISMNEKQVKSKITVLKKMMSFIHDNYSDKLALGDIADSGGISKRTSENIFLRYLNQTPVEYLTGYRLRKSVELMKTDMTILEISLEVGFSSASYYAETFRKVFDKSPAEYRKSIR